MVKINALQWKILKVREPPQNGLASMDGWSIGHRWEDATLQDGPGRPQFTMYSV